MAVIEEEERKNREEIYEGDASLGRRALQLVIMKKQLEQMKTELREMLVYDSPPELGALWTDVNEMMKDMGAQQKVLLTRKMREDARRAERRKAKIKHYMEELTYGLFAIVMALTVITMMTYVSYDRKQRWPELEPAVLAKKREERKQEHLTWLRAQQERIQKEDEEFKRNEDKAKE
jgi:hypothetical protein